MKNLEKFREEVELIKGDKEIKYVSTVADNTYTVIPIDKLDNLIIEKEDFDYAFGTNEFVAMQKLIGKKMKKENEEKAIKDLKNAEILEWEESDSNKLSKILTFKSNIDRSIEGLESQLKQIDKNEESINKHIEYKKHIYTLISNESEEYKELAQKEIDIVKNQLSQNNDVKKKITDAISVIKTAQDKLQWIKNENGKAEFKNIDEISLIIELLDIIGNAQ